MSVNSPKVVAVIPARGGSVGIPRKNVRLLAGKPLIAFSIESCKGSACIDRIFVSTDDAEIAEIALRFGAEVLERPTVLADGETTLDEVISYSVEQLEGRGIEADYIVTVQPTSPLITSETISRAIEKCINDGVETTLTVVDDRHLTWNYDTSGKLVPAYYQRLNRQQLPSNFKETGGCVVCTKSAIIEGSRFGNSVSIIEIDKSEAIDIDDYFDWWLVEKSLNRQLIILHVVGNQISGLGHVYRALTIADRLIDHDLMFLVNSESNLAKEIIESRFYRCLMVEPGEELEKILSEGPKLVINDILDSDEHFIAELSKGGCKVINFEDLGDGAQFADWVINSMYETGNCKNTNVLNGVNYCCLRDEFYSLSPRKGGANINNVLLLFGGTDPAGLTLRYLTWLDQLDGDWSITVILGLGSEQKDEVTTFSREASHEINIVHSTNIISKYMAQADIAITSAGRTVYELGSLGVPVVAIAVNERELTHEFVQNSPGVIFLGIHENVNRQKLQGTVKELISSKILRQKMSQNLHNSGIRSGVENVIDIIHRTLS